MNQKGKLRVNMYNIYAYLSMKRERNFVTKSRPIQEL